MGEKNWQELLVWTFRGERFNDRGIDLRDLQSLVHLRAAVVELAKIVWKEQNPHRERAPKNADDTLELRLFGFQPGSCRVAVYYAPPEPPQQATLMPEAPELSELVWALPVAAHRIAEALRYLAERKEFPNDFPTAILGDLQKALSSGLVANDSVEIKVAPRPVSTTHTSWPGPADTEWNSVAARSAQLQVVVDAPLRGEVDAAVASTARTHTTITGEVTMANVKGYRANLQCDGYQVQIEFPPEREGDVTSALHEHQRVRLRVRGVGEVDLKTGKLKRLTADDLELVLPPDPDAPSEALFERLAHEAPARLLELLDSDLEPAMLTFAAEIAGREGTSEDVVAALLRLLNHESALVREGAIYGLAQHSRPAVDQALEMLANHDPSPGVRIAARDVLEGR